MNIIAGLDDLVFETNRRIIERVKDNPTVDPLQTIPGIGKLRSAVINAEVGNVTRFHRANA